MDCGKFTITERQFQYFRYIFFLHFHTGSADYSIFNGNKFRLIGADKETEISVRSVSFAVSSEPQEFYLDCGRHTEAIWNMEEHYEDVE